MCSRRSVWQAEGHVMLLLLHWMVHSWALPNCKLVPLSHRTPPLCPPICAHGSRW